VWNISNLVKPRYQQLVPNSTSKGHSRIVFSVAAGGKNLSTLTSVSMDRQVR